MLLATGGIVIGIAFWISKNTPKDNLSASVLKSFVEKDTDNDGLNDNMESVYGTDYKNPDSDGDGYLDGEEVISGYDPLKPAPDDKMDTKYVIAPRPAAGSIKNLNFTTDLVDKLTQKIVNEEIIPKKENGSIALENVSGVEEAMEAAVQRSYQEFSLPNILIDQLDISTDNSDEAIKNYARKVLNAIKPINDISVVDLDNGAKSLAGLVNVCESTAAQIKSIEVPSDMASVHKKQIGLLVVQSNIIKAIVATREDPFKANIAIAQINSVNNHSIEILQEIEKIIESRSL